MTKKLFTIDGDKQLVYQSVRTCRQCGAPICKKITRFTISKAKLNPQ